MTVNLQELLIGIHVAVGILLMIVLYHILFVVVYLRKTMKRVHNVSEQVEEVVLKPISMADAAVDTFCEFVEKHTPGEGKKKKGKKRKAKVVKE